MKINWKKLLTNRKFQAAVVAFIASALLAFGVADDTVTKIVSASMAGIALLSHSIAEGILHFGSKGGKDNDKNE